MNWLVHSVAYTPPPFVLKFVPNVNPVSSAIAQPALLLCPGAFTSQSSVMISPVKCFEVVALLIRGPLLECNVI